MEENYCMLEFNPLMEICAEINFRIISSTSSNNEIKMEEKMEEEMKISEKYDFYDYGMEQVQVVKSLPEDKIKILDKKGNMLSQLSKQLLILKSKRKLSIR